MGPLKVVEPNPVFDHAFGLEPVLQFVQIDGLLFERPPQPFDEYIVGMRRLCPIDLASTVNF